MRFSYGGIAAPTAAMAATFLLGATMASAATTYVTPDVIFGTGNANGSFTIDQENGVELGLRAKVRYPIPENRFNYDGVDTYMMPSGTSSGGLPLWNFEWSINTDYSGTSGLKLDDLTYKLQLDTDPTSAETFTSSFDPIFNYLSTPDHAIGDNGTGNGGGTVATSGTDYLNLLANNNVAQNSWSFLWEGALIDPNVNGTYGIQLTAYNADKVQVASTHINVATTPLPATLPLMLSGLGLVGAVARRKSKKAKAAAA